MAYSHLLAEGGLGVGEGRVCLTAHHRARREEVDAEIRELAFHRLTYVLKCTTDLVSCACMCSQNCGNPRQTVCVGTLTRKTSNCVQYRNVSFTSGHRNVHKFLSHLQMDSSRAAKACSRALTHCSSTLLKKVHPSSKLMLAQHQPL